MPMPIAGRFRVAVGLRAERVRGTRPTDQAVAENTGCARRGSSFVSDSVAGDRLLKSHRRFLPKTVLGATDQRGG